MNGRKLVEVIRNYNKIKKEVISMQVKNLLKGRWIAHSFIVGALVLLLLFAFLPGCAPEVIPPAEDAYEKYVASLPEGCFPVPRECFEQAIEEGELHFYNWAEWWPEELFENFYEEFGIKVTVDGFADVDEMLAKFKLNPKTEYDVVIPNIRPLVTLIELGALQRINHDWVPNVNKYLPEATKEAWYDPGYQYSASWSICCPVYGYNTKYVDDPRLPSWSVLYEPDEKYKGRITVVNDMYEAIGAALIYLGYSYNSDDEEELMEAKELMLRQKPYVMAYDAWPYRAVMEEEAWITQQWHGDMWFMHRDLQSLMPAYSPEGGGIGCDQMVIPIAAKNPAAAHLFINYIYRPRVFAQLIERVGHSPNHTAAAQYLSEELREWQPPQEYIDRCEYITAKAYTGKGLELRAAIWEELKR